MKTKKKTSWKTTLFGTLAGLAGIATQIPQLSPQVHGYAAIAAAAFTTLLGVSARDNKVSSEDVGAKPQPVPVQNSGRPGGTRPIE